MTKPNYQIRNTQGIRVPLILVLLLILNILHLAAASNTTADSNRQKAGFLKTSYLQLPPLYESLAGPAIDFSSYGVDSKANPTVPRMDFNREYFKSVLTDLKTVFSAPFHWKGKDWLKLGIVAGLSAILYTNDDGLMRWVQRNHNGSTDRVAKIAEYLGNYMIVIPTIALCYTYGLIFKDAKARETAVLGLKSAAISFMAVYALKILTHRNRPTTDGYGSSTVWDGPDLTFKDTSFPSGHSAIAFSLAVVVCSQYKQKWIRVMAYSAAVLTAVSRIHDRKHWASDIFVGSLLGYFVTKGIMKRKKKRDNALANRLQMMPLIGKESYGLSLTYSW